ncbi:MAG: hypothetical protein M3346_00325 [Actinomycetota bacterium]|nr:hypothetical protein [Actinomycetota bacterium]
MSALSVGSTAVKTQDDEKEDSGPIGKFVKWIPGDAVAFYAAVLTVVGEQTEAGASASTEATTSTTARPTLGAANRRDIDASSPSWFLFGLAVAIGLVVMGAIGKTRRTSGRASSRVPPAPLVSRCVFTGIAFVLWASLLPTSWPNSWSFVQDMGAAYVLVLTAIAAIFTALAERFLGGWRPTTSGTPRKPRITGEPATEKR